MNSHDKTFRRFPKRSRLAQLVASALLAASAFTAAQAATFISVNIAPPPLPVYEQPAIPAPGYIWTPGYWDWDADDNDYYWVPGTWVEPPAVGVLWTPGYWGWSENVYVFHPGYWGPHVGYYGGINYGFGYVGVGYVGGYWNHGGFYYNTAVNHIGADVHITNVYNRTVVNNVTVNHFSFNGPGGVDHQPTREEQVAEHERHTEPVAAQVEQRDTARQEPSLRASQNHGAPPVTATSRPGELKTAVHANAASEPAGQRSNAGSTDTQAHGATRPDANRDREETNVRANPRTPREDATVPPDNAKGRTKAQTDVEASQSMDDANARTDSEKPRHTPAQDMNRDRSAPKPDMRAPEVQPRQGPQEQSPQTPRQAPPVKPEQQQRPQPKQPKQEPNRRDDSKGDDQHDQ